MTALSPDAKVLMVIAQDQFRDEELLDTKSIIEQSGFKTVVSCAELKPVKGMLGAVVQPEKLLSDCKAENFSAIVVVGGMGSPTYLWEDSQLHALIRDFSKQDKVVSAICLSGAVLAKAGVLKGKNATVWPDDTAKKVLQENGANYQNQHMVQDGRIITGDGPEAVPAFANAIVKELSKLTASSCS
jgi:protease I